MDRRVHRIPAIAAWCLLAVVALCCLLALLDPTFDAMGGARGSRSSDHSAMIPIPASLVYQPRLPLKGSFSTLHLHQSESIEEATPTKVAPVQVLVCVEALCIDSQRFFHDQLDIAFNALDHNVMNLTVVSFGNAKLPSDSNSRNITCQHGFGECDANAFEQCAVHLYPEPAQHVPYLSCLFKALPMGHRDDPFEQWMGLEPCAHTHHLDFALLQQCHDNAELTWKLQQEAARATPARHDHVPWVEINGVHMDEESTTLLREVCKVYGQAGGHTPGCSSLDEMID